MAGLLLRPVLIAAVGLLLLFAVVALTDPGRTDPVTPLPNRFGRLGMLSVLLAPALTLATFATLTALTGGSLAVSQPGISFPSAGWPAYQEITAALRELGLRRVQPLPPWQWAVPFVAATALYLLGNAAAIAIAMRAFDFLFELVWIAIALTWERRQAAARIGT